MVMVAKRFMSFLSSLKLSLTFFRKILHLQLILSSFVSYAQPDGQLLWHPMDSIFFYKDYLQKSKVSHLSSLQNPHMDTYLKEYFKYFVFNQEVELSHFVNLQYKLSLQEHRRKFPAVIYAPGYRGLPFENSILCERLAADGYIVLAVPGLGVGFNTDSLGLEFQVHKIKEALEFLKRQPDVDITSISLIGYSWGALSSIVTAMRDGSIHSVVSLDGSIHYFYEVAKQMPGFSTITFDTPTLLISSTNPPINSGFFHDLRVAPSAWIQLENYKHGDFTSYQFLPTVYQDRHKLYAYNKMIDVIQCFLRHSKRTITTLKQGKSSLVLVKN